MSRSAARKRMALSTEAQEDMPAPIRGGKRSTRNATSSGREKAIALSALNATVSRGRLELFWNKVRIAGRDDCWLWMAGTYDNGYGAFAVGNGMSRRVPKWIWEQTFGLLPSGAVLHHKCEERRCMNIFNPEHVVALSSQSEHALLHGIGGDWRRYV
jgi:HNH endonuclease